MRFLVKLLIVVASLAGAGTAAYQPAKSWWNERNRVEYRTASVTRGKITSVVNSTGTVKPVLSVQIGSFVSGPIKKLYVDFNDEVKKDQILAEIDPRLYEANVARDQAVLATRKADLQRIQALLQQATRDEARAEALRGENRKYISDTEFDQYHFNRMSLEAQLVVAEATIKQAEASLDNSVANLNYTEIRSTVDGIIIAKKIEQGQTLAAQFQAPELFTIAPNMKDEMHVYASVDEADIGLIHQAKLGGQPVHFTVDAYPDDLFEGTIFQIRMSATTTQNVVTYPVIVSAPNPDLKLLPDMTANLSFQVEETAENTIRIPNAALRFYPQREQVRPEDHPLLDGVEESQEDDDLASDGIRSALEKAEAAEKRNRRHVWVKEGEFLKAVEVVTGLMDSKYTEMVSGDLTEDQELVTGIKPKR
jgi:HlyD family secretion protein